LLAHGASPAHQSEFGTPPQVHARGPAQFSATDLIVGALATPHNTTRQVAGEFQQKDVASLLSGLARDQDAVGVWSLPPVRPFSPPKSCPSSHPHAIGRRHATHARTQEVLVHLLSYLATAEDLCAVSMVSRFHYVYRRLT
jgi:hypothetical protein